MYDQHRRKINADVINLKHLNIGSINFPHNPSPRRLQLHWCEMWNGDLFQMNVVKDDDYGDEIVWCMYDDV